MPTRRESRARRTLAWHSAPRRQEAELRALQAKKDEDAPVVDNDADAPASEDGKSKCQARLQVTTLLTRCPSRSRNGRHAQRHGPQGPEEQFRQQQGAERERDAAASVVEHGSGMEVTALRCRSFLAKIPIARVPVRSSASRCQTSRSTRARITVMPGRCAFV